MNHTITIQARWDGEAAVWIATSDDVAGLVETEHWDDMIAEVRLVLPELLEPTGQGNGQISLTFRAEEHRDLAGAG